jgi:pimeloyl-ACP methyl ester carboxylesterase
MEDATRWVLLRGLTRGVGHWGGFIEQLDAALPMPAPALAIDLPGNGARYREPSLASVKAMAEDLRAQLQRIGARPPYRVLAMSLGAMVTVAWAERWPQEIERAALVNTSLRPFSPAHHRLRPVAFAKLMPLLLRGADARTWERTIFDLTSRLVTEPQAVIDRWVALREAQPVTRANALRQLLAASRYRAPRQAPPLSWRLLASQCDALVDPRCTLALHRAWQLDAASLRMHPAAGHDLPLDDPAWVIEQLP